MALVNQQSMFLNGLKPRSRSHYRGDDDGPTARNDDQRPHGDVTAPAGVDGRNDDEDYDEGKHHQETIPVPSHRRWLRKPRRLQYLLFMHGWNPDLDGESKDRTQKKKKEERLDKRKERDRDREREKHPDIIYRIQTRLFIDY